MVHNSRSRRIGVCCVAAMAVGLLSAANTGAIRQLTIAPEADIVPLFDGIDAGRLQVRLSVQDAYRANVFITNATAQTVNVALPKAAVGVHVLPQLNPGFFGNGNNPLGNGQNGFFGNQNQQNPTGALNAIGNAAQDVGGPMGPTGVFNNGNGNQPFGFPSVPPEWATKTGLDQYAGFVAAPAGKTIQLQMRTVCLNYGRPDPHPGLPYALTSVEKYSSDPVLAQLLESYSTRMDQPVMQAAAWHVANDLSWDRLTRLPDPKLRGTGARMFNARQLQTAQVLLKAVETPAAQRPQPTVQVATTGRER